MQSQLNIPRVTYTPKLATYMRKKGWRHIAIERASACGCCVDLSEVATRFVDDAAADELRRLNDRRYEDSRIAELVTVIEQETAALKE